MYPHLAPPRQTWEGRQRGNFKESVNAAESISLYLSIPGTIQFISFWQKSTMFEVHTKGSSKINSMNKIEVTNEKLTQM